MTDQFYDPDSAVASTRSSYLQPEQTDKSLLEKLDAHSDEYNEKLRQLQSVLDPAEHPDLYSQPARVKHSVLDVPWPRIFSDFSYLKELVDGYFEECDDLSRTYTLPDLAYALGFSSKDGLDMILQQANLFPASAAVLQRALLRIEGQRNRQLVDGQGQMTGRVLDLKVHHGWNDSAGNESGGNVTNIQNNVYNNTLNAMPPEPKDMSQWVQWYKEQMGDRKKAGDNVTANNTDQGALDVTPDSTDNETE